MTDIEKLRRKTRPQSGDMKHGKSSITNGRYMFASPDASNAAWNRRFKDIYEQIIDDADDEGVRQLARRVATISIACEKMEAEASVGREVNYQLYGACAEQLGHTLQALSDYRYHAHHQAQQ